MSGDDKYVVEEDAPVISKEYNELLKVIETQLYGINAINISLHWIGMKKTPTFEEICELNKMLGIIIKEIRDLRETGTFDMAKIIEDSK